MSALPPGEVTVGNQATAAVFTKLFEGQILDACGSEQQQVLVCGDLALTSPRLPTDGRTTTEVARRQADGSWLWVIDQPNAHA